MREEHPDEPRRRRNIERHLAAITAANQGSAREFLQLKLAQGVRSTTRQHYAIYLHRLDEHIQGKPWIEVDANDVTGYLAAMHLAGKAYATMNQAAIHAKAFLTWVHGVERLPLRFRLAFDMKRNRDVVEPEPVPDDDFGKFMDALAVIPKNPLERLRNQALGGIMWEAGFRVSEAISLNVGSCRFDDTGGVWLHMPHDGHDLKTGPRKVFIVRYADVLRAWLQVHPRRDETEAPVFFSYSRRSHGKRLTKMGVQHVFNRAEMVAGIPHINTHRLRHTAATRDAQNGFMEEDLRTKYGWAAGSKTPSRYIHQSARHQEELARKSVGIGTAGVRTGDADVDPNNLEATIQREIIRFLAKRLS